MRREAGNRGSGSGDDMVNSGEWRSSSQSVLNSAALGQLGALLQVGRKYVPKGNRASLELKGGAGYLGRPGVKAMAFIDQGWRRGYVRGMKERRGEGRGGEGQRWDICW